MTAAPSAPLLLLQGVTKCFAAGLLGCTARVRVLLGASLELRGGELVALTGGTGAGKTTLLLCAAGMLRPDTGAVRWSGEAASPRAADPVAFISESPVFHGYLSVGDVLALAAAREPYLEHLARAVLRRLRLATRLQLRVAELCSYDRRRLALACALLRGPRVLLVDHAVHTEADALLLSTVAHFALRGGAALCAAPSASVLAPYVTRELRIANGVLHEVQCDTAPTERALVHAAAGDDRLPLRRPPMVAEPQQLRHAPLAPVVR